MSLAAKTTHGSVPVMVGAFKTLYVPGDEPVPGYVLIAPLGRGQSGEVWKANGPGVEVAVKIVNLAERIGQKELRALRRIKDIKHPNLMPIYGFWLKTASGKTLGESQLQESAVGGLARTRVLAASDQTLIPDSFPEKLAADETPVQLIIAMGLGSQTLGDRLDA